MRKALMEKMGMGPADGLILAWIPVFDQVPTTQKFLDRDFYVWETYNDYMLVDSTDPTTRFWQLKCAARQLGYNHPEPIWSGPAQDFRVECLPELQRHSDNLQLGLRAYHHGPWVTNFTKEI